MFRLNSNSIGVIGFHEIEPKRGDLTPWRVRSLGDLTCFLVDIADYPLILADMSIVRVLTS